MTELWRSQADLDASLEQIKGSDEVAAVKALVEGFEIVELDLLGGKGPAAAPPPQAPGAAPHTILKLTETEDAAAKHGLGAFGEARFVSGDLGAAQTGVSHHRLRPGARQPFGHRHERAEEVYIVMSGSGRVKLDDEIAPLEALDALRVAPAVMRAFEAGPDGLELLAVGPQLRSDGEIVRGWWTDAEV